MKTCIYGIRDLEIDKFIYVGKSNESLRRFEHHMKRADNDCIRVFVEEKGQDNFQVETLEVVEFQENRGWVKREKFWVKKFREEGHPLCNKNGGGGGVTKHTEEWKREESKRKSGENNPKYWLGKCRSKETCAKISKAHLGKHLSEETIAKIRKANSGENHPNYGKHRPKGVMANAHEANSKPYPAFYNEETGEYIPAGKGLCQMCREVFGTQKLGDVEFRRLYERFCWLRNNPAKHSKDGWGLASKGQRGC